MICGGDEHLHSARLGFSPANYQGLLHVALAAHDFLLVIKMA